MQDRIGPVKVFQRTAIFEDELTASVRVMRLQFCCLIPSKLVNLTQTLKISNLQRELINHAHLFYMNPCTKVCQHLGLYPFKEDIFVQIDLKHKERLHFKYRKIGQPLSSALQKTGEIKQMNNPNSRKSKERTISEVRQHLQYRNKIYQNATVSGQSYTLQQAADIIGLPKKTLDDYSRQIKLAQTYGFDFERNKDAGMGFLRNFVKQQSEKPRFPYAKTQFVQPDVFLTINPKQKS